MAFSDKVVEEAWKRSGGHCECKREHCGHGARCNKQLVWDNRGRDGARGAWEAHHITSSNNEGPDILSNCEIICIECHKNTRSYGRS